MGNICCCAWAIVGGAIAAYMYIKRSTVPVRSADGAVLGVMAGIIGTVVAWVIGIPLSLLIGDPFSPMVISLLENIDPRQAEIYRRQMEMAQNQPFIQKLPAMMLGMFMGLVAYTAFSTVGGLIGTALFEKRKAGPAGMPPPPPPSYGNQPY
jgi:hypothetical protein